MKIGSHTPVKSRANIYPQDSTVSPPTQDTMDSVKIGRRVSGPRMGVVTGRGEFKASADKEGHYLYSPPEKRFNQVQAFFSAHKTLDLFEEYAQRPLSWAFERQELGVIPHAGEGRNAYYARWNGAIAFYSFDSRDLEKTVHISQSADVVSHETGHAILDGMKPQWGKTFDRETKATHEAFGDCAAMLLAVSRPENRSLALTETAGDLSKDNCIARIAEEFGTAVRLANRNPDDDKPYLRNANNDFVYQPPHTLPRDGPRDELTAESHSFCQIFTRAFYNGIVKSFERLKGQGVDPDRALDEAAQGMGTLLAKGITLSAPNRARFQDVANSMLRVDQLQGGDFHQALAECFLESGILSETDIRSLEQPLPQGAPEEIVSGLSDRPFSLQRTVEGGLGLKTYEFGFTEQIELPGLYEWGEGVSVEVEAGVSLTYDENNKLVHISYQAADPEAEFEGAPSATELFGGSLPEAKLVPTEGGLKLERIPVFQEPN